MWNVNNVSDPTEKNVGVLSVMNSLQGETPFEELKFETDEKQYNASLTLYGLAQCTRDIGTDPCYECLEELFSIIKECCQEKVGWRVYGPNCNIRHERFRFYADPASPAPAQLAPPPPPTAKPPPPDNPGELNICVIAHKFSRVMSPLGGQKVLPEIWSIPKKIPK